jgi:hypothetical protein
MARIVKISILIACCYNLLSCTPKGAYEIKSPCVLHDEGSNPYYLTPCARKPMNQAYRALVLHDSKSIFANQL